MIDLREHGIDVGGLGEFFGDGSDGVLATNIQLLPTPTITALLGGNVAYLSDHNPGTIFSTNDNLSSSNSILKIDFGQAVTIKKVTFEKAYLTTNNSGVSMNLTVGYSTNGTNYSSAGVINPTTSPLIPTDLTLELASPITARYWQVDVYFWPGASFKMNGDLIFTPGQLITLTAPTSNDFVLKQCTSVNIQANGILTTDKPCQGLIIFSQGDVVIDGLIDMSKKAALGNNAGVVPMPMTKKKDIYTPRYPTLKSCLSFNGGEGATDFPDINLVWTTMGDAHITTSDKKFGMGCLTLDGTLDWIRSATTDIFDTRTSDFTYQCWFKRAAIGTTQCLFDMSSGTNPFQVLFTSTNNIQVALSVNSNMKTINSSNVVNDTTTWHHLALVKYGDVYTLYIDGISVGTVTATGGLSPLNGVIAKIGTTSGESSAHFNGKIDDFSFFTSAMYTSNFAVPTEEIRNTYTIDTQKCVQKFNQLTTVLNDLRGGQGGNGGFGGGYNSSTNRQTQTGVGGRGRLNAGGIGGGGSGGAAQGYPSHTMGGIGGSVESAEGIGKALSTLFQVSFYNSGNSTINGQNGTDGGGGTGGQAMHNTAGYGYTVQSHSIAFGGGGGGSGGGAFQNAASGTNGEYAGGLVMIIAKGKIYGSGSIKCNGGKGGSGGYAGAENTSYGAGGGGGGGGSGGGVIAILHKGEYSPLGLLQVNGGLGGSPGGLAGTGENGGSGTAGSIGTILTQHL